MEPDISAKQMEAVVVIDESLVAWYRLLTQPVTRVVPIHVTPMAHISHLG